MRGILHAGVMEMLKRTDGLTKGLAITGTVLVSLPLLAPLAMTHWAAVGTQGFNFDWLIPAEMFPIAVIGGVILLSGSIRAHAWRRTIAWGLALGIGMLVAGQILAIVTGLASGAAEPTGWQMWAVTATIGAYAAALAVMAAGGIMLIRDLFHHERAVPAIPAM